MLQHSVIEYVTWIADYIITRGTILALHKYPTCLGLRLGLGTGHPLHFDALGSFAD